LKDGSELAEVTTGGRLFHTREAATLNADRRTYKSSYVSIIQCNIMSLINVQYDVNGPVERRETSCLLMSTCPITMTNNETFNVIQGLHKQQTKSTKSV